MEKYLKLNGYKSSLWLQEADLSTETLFITFKLKRLAQPSLWFKVAQIIPADDFILRETDLATNSLLKGLRNEHQTNCIELCDEPPAS